MLSPQKVSLLQLRCGGEKKNGRIESFEVLLLYLSISILLYIILLVQREILYLLLSFTLFYSLDFIL